MTARKAPKASSADVLSALLADARKGKASTGKAPKATLSRVSAPEGMTPSDRKLLQGSADVVRLALSEYLTAASAALSAADVDPEKVTLTRKPNDEISANLPVPYVTPDGTRYVNLTVTLGGTVGEMLRPFAATKDLTPEEAPAPAPKRSRRSA